MNRKAFYNEKSEEISYLKEQDSRLKHAIELVGEIEVFLHEDPYVFFVQTIIGQMLSNKVADILAERVRNLCGGVISMDTIQAADPEALRGCGLSKSKISYILGVTEHIAEHPEFLPGIEKMNDQDAVKELTKLKGIGAWTAKMYLIFVLGRDDILPYEDGAFLQAYQWLYETEDLSVKSIKKTCAPWSPHSSVAARYLYRILDMGFTKTPGIF